MLRFCNKLRSDTTAEIEITERQQYCLNHVRAADARDGTSVEHVNAHDLIVKDLYQ